MPWKFKFSDKSKKELKKLNKNDQLAILRYLKNRVSILQNPKLLGKPLKKGLKGLWRYRINKYRIICNIKENEVVILVLKIGIRKEIYDSKN